MNRINEFDDCYEVVLVGDVKVGKTSLIQRILGSKFNETYSKTTGLEKCHWAHSVANRNVHFTIWDTTGTVTSGGKTRSLLYNRSDIFLLCFKISDPKSLHTALNVWTPEIRAHSPMTPIILVGCQSDLRSHRDTLSALSQHGHAPISSDQGLTVSHQIGAILYVETSAKTCCRSAISVLEVAALALMGKLSPTPTKVRDMAPLLPPKFHLRASPPLPPKPPVRRAVSQMVLNKENLYSPEPARSHSNLLQINQKSNKIARERSLLSLSTRTPKIARKEFSTSMTSNTFASAAEQTVTIKCQRLTAERQYEEVDVEVPTPIYETLRFYNTQQHNSDKLEDTNSKISFKARIKKLFAVK